MPHRTIFIKQLQQPPQQLNFIITTTIITITMRIIRMRLIIQTESRHTCPPAVAHFQLIIIIQL